MPRRLVFLAAIPTQGWLLLHHSPSQSDSGRGGCRERSPWQSRLLVGGSPASGGAFIGKGRRGVCSTINCIETRVHGTVIKSSRNKNNNIFHIQNRLIFIDMKSPPCASFG